MRQFKIDEFLIFYTGTASRNWKLIPVYQLRISIHMNK